MICDACTSVTFELPDTFDTDKSCNHLSFDLAKFVRLFFPSTFTSVGQNSFENTSFLVHDPDTNDKNLSMHPMCMMLDICMSVRSFLLLYYGTN